VSTSGITSSPLSEIVGSPSTANQFATDLNQLAQDLQSGNLSVAQDDYVKLSEDALNGATSSMAITSASGITTRLLSALASSSRSSNSFVSELNQLGTDLQNGHQSSAQEDMLSLDATALNAASAASASSSGISSTTSSATPSSQAGMTELIQAIVQAMSAGDTSAASTAMLGLASVSPSSAGASYLQTVSESLSAGSSDLSSSNSISQLLQDLDTSSLNSSQAVLTKLPRPAE
jgi:hypothetical protein